MGPSHSLCHIDVKCFINIGCLDASPRHTLTVLSESITDGGIELSLSSALSGRVGVCGIDDLD
ncbi:Hypothetical protein SMAX5B_015111 [Scophthalmus maximus]|uniref:Uncharacterized protein n=1 Tax=Scophthalmus maximus TaxID=52904 RepID=A0A2U9CFC5_SCOMX|nr:Hypothetical protein SMAX5B_015111 [Scophthalmus maximus]